ncbi:MAG TPA: hypothetical protein VF701_18860 [Thermoanaerobaculia bacterium]
MSSFFTAALSFPTVVFTVLIALFLIYGLLALAGVAEIDWLPAGESGSALEALGIAGVPIAVVGGITATIGWVTSLLAMRLLDTTNLMTGTLVGLGAAALGLFVASRAARPLRPFFATAQAPSRRAFIGKLCTIRSGSVTANAGRAELEDGGAGLIIEVRCFRDNSLAPGSLALVYDVDDKTGVYHIAPVDPSLAEADPVRIASRVDTPSHDNSSPQVTQ